MSGATGMQRLPRDATTARPEDVRRETLHPEIVRPEDVRALLLRRPLRVGPAVVLWHPRTAVVALVLVLALAAAALGALLQGSTPLAPDRLLAALFGPTDLQIARVVWQTRVPRVVTGALVGAALGISGAVFQSTARNALASPDIIGFVSGAASGAVAAIILAQAGPWTVVLCSFASGLGTVALVMALATRGGALGGERIVLVGIGISALLGAVNTILLTKSDPNVAMSGRIWLTGSLNARSWSDAGIALGCLVLCAPILMALSRRIDALETGDDLALQAGVPMRSTRLLASVAGTGLAAGATAAAGPISFVALAAPHLARGLTRSASVPLLVAGLLGALLLVGADTLSQALPLPVRFPVALTTGVLGGIYLLVMLRRLR
jgi:iron complex transport system permease protein